MELTEGSHAFGINVEGFCCYDSINALACDQKKTKVLVGTTLYSLFPNTEVSINMGYSSTSEE
jgi:hypothetical protein